MKKSTAYLYLIIFVIICVLPIPVYTLIGPYVDQEDYEKRAAADIPTFSIETIDEYPGNYEAYFNDTVPFRSQLIEINSLINYSLFKESPVSHVIVGKDEWFFYNPSGTDGNPIADVTGANYLTEDELALYANNLTAVRDELQAQGKEFIIMIAPNKESIYGGEYLPSKYDVVEQSRADQLVAYLNENTDLKVVYPKKNLQDFKKTSKQLIYYKTDTHWNKLGAYIGARELLAELNITLPDISDMRVTEKEVNSGDLATMMALTKYIKSDVDYDVTGYPRSEEVSKELPIEDNISIEHYTSTEGDGRTLFLVRDSFSVAMLDYVTTQFKDSHVVANLSYTKEYLHEVDPDIVVIEVVERYMEQLLVFGV